MGYNEAWASTEGSVTVRGKGRWMSWGQGIGLGFGSGGIAYRMGQSGGDF